MVQLKVEIEKKTLKYMVPFNISCQKPNEIDDQLVNLKTTPSADEIELSWESSGNNEISKYLIFYMDGWDCRHAANLIKEYFSQHQFSTFAISEIQSVSLRNLTEKTLYQICIAPVDKKSRISKYKCIEEYTDFINTGPVTNVTSRASSDTIFLSWSKPEYKFDVPSGYIVRYNDAIKCHTIIINMVNLVIILQINILY